MVPIFVEEDMMWASEKLHTMEKPDNSTCGLCLLFIHFSIYKIHE